MTKVMTVSQARTNIYKIMDETAQTHQPIMITGKRNNVVMLNLKFTPLPFKFTPLPFNLHFL